MNRKEYSNKNKFTEGIKEAGKDLYPLFKKIINPVKHFMLSNPVRTATIMFSILLLNTALLFFIIYRKTTSKQPVSYTAVIKNFKKKKAFRDASGMDNHISMGSLFEIKNIRDSLEYLMNKKVQTKEDTLCFIRLYKRYRRIDPSIVNALKELKKKKTDSLHLNHK